MVFDKINTLFFKKIILKYNVRIQLNEADNISGWINCTYFFRNKSSDKKVYSEIFYVKISQECNNIDNNIKFYIKLDTKDIYQPMPYQPMIYRTHSMDISIVESSIYHPIIDNIISIDNLNNEYYMDVILDEYIKYIDMLYNLENFNQNHKYTMENINQLMRNKKLNDIKEINNV